MCYRCQVCLKVVYGAMRKYIVPRFLPKTTVVPVWEEDRFGKPYKTYRPVIGEQRSEIAQEVPVCTDCEGYLKLGIPLEQLQRQKGVPAMPVVSAENPGRRRKHFKSLAERLGISLDEEPQLLGTAG